MTRKFKFLCLGAIAALAISAVAVMSAGAETGGHFTSAASGTTTIQGHDEGTANHLVGGLGTISCNPAEVTYHGKLVETATELTVEPTYNGCTFSGGGAAVVTMNGCHYLFTIRGVEPDKKHNTVHLVCPVGKQVEVHLTGVGCTLTIKAQTPTEGGVVYTTGNLEGQKHDITVDVTVKGIHTERHGGACIFVPTTDTGSELTGEVTVKGFDSLGNQTDITATGK